MSIVERMPFEKYVDLPGAHATALKDILVSPRHYWRRQQQPRPDKDAFRVGRACHTAALEPDRFLLEYAVWRTNDDGSTRRRYGKEWEAFKGVNSDKTILTEAQYATALACRDAAREHSLAGKLLSEPGKNEVSVQFKHERTGINCKARLDRVCSALIDIKTCRDPAAHKFNGDAARMSYAMQMSFYWRAARAAGLGELPVQIIAIQNVEPFDVVLYDVDTEELLWGEEQYEKALDLLKECTDKNEWPGIAPREPVKLRRPAWANPESNKEPLTMNGVELF